MVEKEFGRALRALRLSRNLSQQDFTSVITREHLSRLERGLSQPNLALVRHLATVLKIHPLSLLTLAFHRADDSETLKNLFSQIEADLANVRSPKDDG